MEPASIIAIITAAIPFVTAGFKKVFKTDKMQEGTRKGINSLIPVLLGVVSSGLVAYNGGSDWVTALAIGLGSGGVASSARDIEKNLIGLVKAVLDLFKKK